MPYNEGKVYFAMERFFMVVTINIGNSHILFGVWQEDCLLFRSTISSDLNRSTDEYAIQLHSILSLHQVSLLEISGGIISSVVPSLTGRIRSAIQQVCHTKFFTVGPGLKSGLSIRIDNPAQLGAELVCAAVAALESFPPPLIVITMDTAISIMAINENQQLLGGSIFPGPILSFDALIQKTAQLSQVDLDSCPNSIIGTNTISSMQSGFIWGTACMLDGMIAKFQQELNGNALVVCTGRIPGAVRSACTTSMHYQQNLILRGLLLIYRKNSR